MNNFFVQISTAVIGSIGFAIYFNINKSKILFVAVGALVSWVTYLLCFNITNNMFIANFIPAISVCIYSEIMARVLKTPANIILIPSIIPLLPGSNFYYTMVAALSMNVMKFKEKGLETVIIVLGITSGIVIGFFIFQQVLKLFCKP